ncbi:hypothetical protein BDV96DRAFT_503305 [Lophiotrema nucula]|uniref:Diphthamide biosynthesis protein 4 n=1 Tax=Lophiotrema nucula TaxID=690887 RepID=A0A6A5YPR0_9PLEO|nr:hypothetical protein BDV96DRAFT_503305 [Lophiotrema nucula]
MATKTYKKNYYAILGLETPTWRTSTPLDPHMLKMAYRSMLLCTHPDKSRSRRYTEDEGGDEEAYESKYTVDDVKEAYQILAKKEVRGEYDKWLAATYEAGEAFSSSTPDAAKKEDDGFVLGLEVLDLSDFEVISVAPSTVSTPSTSTTPPATIPSSSAAAAERHEEEEEDEQEWRRDCRCGHSSGFKITESSLLQAEKRGEKEVLVGCEGCSLWVRVSFDVELEDAVAEGEQDNRG